MLMRHQLSLHLGLSQNWDLARRKGDLQLAFLLAFLLDVLEVHVLGW
jgi:hypothetical protein